MGIKHQYNVNKYSFHICFARQKLYPVISVKSIYGEKLEQLKIDSTCNRNGHLILE